MDVLVVVRCIEEDARIIFIIMHYKAILWGVISVKVVS